MFKKTLLACACFMAIAATAQAADNVDLKVDGTLVNGSCTPSLENGGVVDFGHIPVGNLSKTDINQLGKRNIVLTVTCDNTMPVAWQAIDNRSSTVQNISVKGGLFDGSDCNSADNHFGLGQTAGNINIGDYCIIVNKDAITVDGIKAKFIETNYRLAKGTWDTLTGGDATNGVNGQWRYITASDTAKSEPLAGKVFIYPLVVSAAIQGTDALAITDTTDFDGSTTISLVYI
ncbi:DUF1120 domain-containing protein [Cronobacter sakazakii]|uniref:DUF1120 domain-containing protein n=1 Tax=Cronobacter sakazakii TaxID=28141 RepID=UPI000A1FA7EE|nr:DUF1120 domain-containing protein [Cronobacter sakazakii]AZP35087.1 DUF1120 domain-containing protein [Cronobacter sakazakii]ELY2596254.1 DUF1120 domain-containing protein [Cronobacter sakazakii]PUY29750.1 DUF1120 domain-containing protein [Cronobacter sakazakii]